MGWEFGSSESKSDESQEEESVRDPRDEVRRYMCSSLLRIPTNIPLITLDYQAQMEFAMGTEVHCMSMYMDPPDSGGPVLRRSTRIGNRKSFGPIFSSLVLTEF